MAKRHTPSDFQREGCNDPEMDLIAELSRAHNAEIAQVHGLPALDPVELAAEQLVLKAPHEPVPTETDADADVAED